jgi:hypothetical protein
MALPPGADTYQRRQISADGEGCLGYRTSCPTRGQCNSEPEPVELRDLKHGRATGQLDPTTSGQSFSATRNRGLNHPRMRRQPFANSHLQM